MNRREALAAAVAGGLSMTAAAQEKHPEKPPHIVEKPDMKGRMVSGLPSPATEDGAVVVKSFFAKMPTYPDIRFREFFDPRYLKKHGLTDRDIAFETADHQGIDSLQVADDNLTALVVLEVKGGKASVRHAMRGSRRPHLHFAGESPRPEDRRLQAVDSADESEVTLWRADRKQRHAEPGAAGDRRGHSNLRVKGSAAGP